MEQILGFEIEDLKSNATTVNNCMLAEANLKLKHRPKDIRSYTSQRTSKNKVYTHILDYFVFERYTDENSLNLKEANILNLVLYIISPILVDFQNMKSTKCNIQLKHTKQIISKDFLTGAHKEFLVVRQI